MLSRLAEKCEVAGAEQIFYVVVGSRCGKHAQAKKKTIMQPRTEHLSDGERRAVDRISQGKNPDRTNNGRVASCFDVAAGRLVSFAALAPAKLGSRRTHGLIG